ncbi:MAG: flagellar type III secretion system pore protein FliP [Thermodesulfobacteriota bacterium]
MTRVRSLTLSAALVASLVAPASPCMGLAEIQIHVGDSAGLAPALQILLLLTVLSLAPALVLMLTSFTRIVVVLSLLRQALGTQQLPPGQILVGLALFLTAFVMAPVWSQVHTQALEPYLAQQIDHKEALNRAAGPISSFMLSQTREKDIQLLMGLAGMERPEKPRDVPLSVLIPAFMMSEMKTAFQIGFILYVPFLILDLVVSSLLLSMGMLMLPPIMISLPFKLLLFVLVDGWNLLVGSLIRSFG